MRGEGERMAALSGVTVHAVMVHVKHTQRARAGEAG